MKCVQWNPISEITRKLCQKTSWNFVYHDILITSTLKLQTINWPKQSCIFFLSSLWQGLSPNFAWTLKEFNEINSILFLPENGKTLGVLMISFAKRIRPIHQNSLNFKRHLDTIRWPQNVYGAPEAVVHWCSLKFRRFHRKIPVLKSLMLQTERHLTPPVAASGAKGLQLY